MITYLFCNFFLVKLFIKKEKKMILYLMSSSTKNNKKKLMKIIDIFFNKVIFSQNLGLNKFENQVYLYCQLKFHQL
jgi:hypothetical protein